MKFILAFTTLIAFSAAQQWLQPQFGQMPINYGQPAFRLPYQPYPAFRVQELEPEIPLVEATTVKESNSASTRLGKVAPVLMEIRGLKTEIFGNPIQDMAQFRANPPKLSTQGSEDRSAKILKVLLLEELIANFLSVTPAPTTAKRTSRTKVGNFVNLFVEGNGGKFKINSELLNEKLPQKEGGSTETITQNSNGE